MVAGSGPKSTNLRPNSSSDRRSAIRRKTSGPAVVIPKRSRSRFLARSDFRLARDSTAIGSATPPRAARQLAGSFPPHPSLSRPHDPPLTAGRFWSRFVRVTYKTRYRGYINYFNEID
jgi:hypothetical protein